MVVVSAMQAEFKVVPAIYADAGIHIYPAPEEYDKAYGVDGVLNNLTHMIQIKDSNAYAGRLVT